MKKDILYKYLTIKHIKELSELFYFDYFVLFFLLYNQDEKSTFADNKCHSHVLLMTKIFFSLKFLWIYTVIF